MSRTTNFLPLELVRAILREATLVPGAFDYPTANYEDHDAQVRDRILQSYSVKRALSLVSKEINSINQEFLYEIIIVTELQHARALALVLRKNMENGLRRGWWCRRLEVTVHRHYHNWRDGQYTLWGLLPACPRAVDLRVSLRYQRRPEVACELGRGPPKRFPVSLPLLQIIASVQGRSLRSLYLGGRVSVPFAFVESLLSYLPGLEVCRFDNVRRLPDAVQRLLFDVDEYGSGHDELQEEDDQWSNKDATSRQYTELTIDREEYLDAARKARWPKRPCPDSARPVHLPNLRILQFSRVTRAMKEWRLPALESLSVSMNPNLPAEGTHRELVTLLGPIASQIRFFRWVKNWQDDVVLDPWDLLERLPNLVHLRIHPEFTITDTHLNSPHTSLEVISILRETYEWAEELLLTLKSIATQREEGRPPRLRRVELSHTNLRDPNFDEVSQSFAGMGVEWEPNRYTEKEVENAWWFSRDCASGR